MATLVLTVAGGAIAGPAGATAGSLLGNAIDHRLFGAARRGGRLSDLRVQAGAYGTPIPKLFGTMRVAGTVIWATDLVEHPVAGAGAGKGGGGYAYTASFAVALSSRPIRAVRRIWAEGRLICDAAGEMKLRTGLRLHRGDEDQAPDPLIAAAEGAARAPAHRGLAYAVFEDMALDDFGGRIPSLSFEVEADAGPVAPGAVAAMLGGGVVAAGAALGPPLTGYAAEGDDMRAVLAMLVEAGGGWFRAAGGRIVPVDAGAGATPVVDAGAGAAGARRPGRGVRAIDAIAAAPATFALGYYDPARDYQAGLQQAVRPGAGARGEQVALPAAIPAPAARAMAEAALARAEAARERRTLTLGWDALALEPGACVTIAGEPGCWRIVQWRLEAMVVTIECVRVPEPVAAAPASAGRAVTAPALAIGPTILHAFELPAGIGGAAAVPRIGVAAAGGPGWRRAALMLADAGEARWEPAGATAAPAVLGTIAVPPVADAIAAIADRRSRVEVVLAHPGMMLGDADAAAMAAGANRALIGDELVQFARAEPLGGARWRLQGLWRGRQGSEAAIGGAGAGDRFVLLTPATLAVLTLDRAATGGTAAVLAEGVADGEGVIARCAVTGRGCVPPAPVHLRAARRPDGALVLAWVRRSRDGWDWIDGVDAPLGEDREAYRVTLTDGAGRIVAAIDCAEPQLRVAPAAAAGVAAVAVCQIGTNGASPPARTVLSAASPPGGAVG